MTHNSTTRLTACFALFLAVLVVLPRTIVCGAAPAKGACHALIIVGLPAAPVYARRYRDWADRFRTHLTESARVPVKNTQVLFADEATGDAIREALRGLAGKVKPKDQFVLILIGHGEVADLMPTMLLRGPDLSARDLADAADLIEARNQVVLNFLGNAGDCLRFFAKQNRVNIAATSPTEVNESVLAEFFLRGLESRRADGEGAPDGDAKDGTITLLEAYNWATRQTVLWIARQKATSRGWKLDGKESVQVFKRLCTGKRDEPAARSLDPRSNASKEDEAIPLRPVDGKIDGFWRGRRVITEHAVLEDCGQESGVSALREKGYSPIAAAKEGEPGSLASRVVLGRAELLPARSQ